MDKNHNMMKIRLAILIVLLGAGLSLAQKNPKDKFSFPPLNPIQMPEVQRVELPNGLKLFLVEDHEFPTIDLWILIRTGAVFEPASKVGLAAITGTALRTGGTRSKTGDEIDRELDTLAASLSIGISSTAGNISLSTLKENFDQALAILADILTEPAFSEDQIELARIQQRTAIARRNENIRSIAAREFAKLIYGQDSPYARHPEYQTINNITRNDVVDFYQKYFHPNNAWLAVCGDFKSREMIDKIAAVLGKWQRGRPSTESWPSVSYQERYSVNFIEKPDVNQSNIILGHLGGLMSNPDYPALLVMNQILSFERMFKRIRTDEGLAYNVWGSYGAGYVNPGIFSCGAQTKSESTVRALEIMLQELKRIMEQEVSDEELARAKDGYLNSYVFNFETRSQIVDRMLTFAYYGYPLDFMEQVKSKVEKVTKADILRVARTYLNPDKVQILVVGKKEDFDKPLSSLGDVNIIDITIPPPR